VTSYSHDTGKGLLSYIQDANGNKVSYTYDNRGRVTGVQVKDSGNVARGELSYDYGANGLSELDSGSTVYTLSYDAFGNASTIEIGTTTLVSYTYDVNNGNLLRTTYANGFYTDYEYDELERVKTVRENGTIIYTCTYDADGNVNCIDDRKWSVLQQYEYDSIGRLVRMEQKSKSVYQEWKEVTSDSTSQVETVKYVAPDMTQNYAYSYFTYTDLIGSVTLPNNAHTGANCGGTGFHHTDTCF
jgi:YD repeat-containing protein